jgi:cytochrome c oxidase subunit 2
MIPAVLAVLLQSAPVATDPGAHSILHPVSPQGAQIEWLYWVIFWICFAVYVLMIFGFTTAAAKSYSVDREPPPIIEDEEGDRKSSWFVGSAVAVTVLTLFVVLGFSVAKEKPVQGTPKTDSVTIQVTGHQWWWEVTYPNSQANQTINTANEIHIPIGTPIVILTKSTDVIHSFWAPSITGKRDLVPGISSAFSFQVDTPGYYRGQCAEFCGLQHAHMGFAVVAESADDFEAWKKDQVSDAVEPANPQDARGREVFLTHACLMCHTIQGTQAGSRMGPDLTHLASRRMIAAETLPNTPGALGGWIVDPQRVKPGNHMSPNGLTGDDLQALISYLQSLK